MQTSAGGSGALLPVKEMSDLLPGMCNVHTRVCKVSQGFWNEPSFKNLAAGWKALKKNVNHSLL